VTRKTLGFSSEGRQADSKEVTAASARIHVLRRSWSTSYRLYVSLACIRWKKGMGENQVCRLYCFI